MDIIKFILEEATSTQRSEAKKAAKAYLEDEPYVRGQQKKLYNSLKEALYDIPDPNRKATYTDVKEQFNKYLQVKARKEEYGYIPIDYERVYQNKMKQGSAKGRYFSGMPISQALPSMVTGSLAGMAGNIAGQYGGAGAAAIAGGLVGQFSRVLFANPVLAGLGAAALAVKTAISVLDKSINKLIDTITPVSAQLSLAFAEQKIARLNIAMERDRLFGADLARGVRLDTRRERINAEIANQFIGAGVNINNAIKEFKIDFNTGILVLLSELKNVGLLRTIQERIFRTAEQQKEYEKRIYELLKKVQDNIGIPLIAELMNFLNQLPDPLTGKFQGINEPIAIQNDIMKPMFGPVQ